MNLINTLFASLMVTAIMLAVLGAVDGWQRKDSP
jgi:hypothetical protein